MLQRKLKNCVCLFKMKELKKSINLIAFVINFKLFPITFIKHQYDEHLIQTYIIMTHTLKKDIKSLPSVLILIYSKLTFNIFK